ncbi:unnamed protein product, partial [Polarella glacialis]
DLLSWAPPSPREKAMEALTDGAFVADPTTPNLADDGELAGPGSVVGPEYPQGGPDEPFVYYHKVAFVDTKPTGLRMSACLSAMDECRTDAFATCDQTVEAMRHATDPFTQVAIELHPAIARLSPDESDDG